MVELTLIIEGQSYTYTAEEGTARAKELQRVSKLLANTVSRLDAKLLAIRQAEAES